MAQKEIITNLTGHLLIATHRLAHSFFDHSVIYLCHHDSNGAMGMIINQPIPDIHFSDIVEAAGFEMPPNSTPIICSGGPVDSDRGFVLHSNDYRHKHTVKLQDDIYLSATADIVTAIAAGIGPEKLNFCLGYAGWAPLQLEDEIATDSWFVTRADAHLVFDSPMAERYQAALTSLGVHATHTLSPTAFA